MVPQHNDKDDDTEVIVVMWMISTILKMMIQVLSHPSIFLYSALWDSLHLLHHPYSTSLPMISIYPSQTCYLIHHCKARKEGSGWLLHLGWPDLSAQVHEQNVGNLIRNFNFLIAESGCYFWQKRHFPQPFLAHRILL